MAGECPFCGEPAVRTMVGGIIAFRCGTEGPYVDGDGEATYDTGRWCDEHTYQRLLAKKDAEIERLTRERDELIETTTNALHHVGKHVLGERFRGSKSPLHQRLSMVVHALAARAAGGE